MKTTLLVGLLLAISGQIMADEVKAWFRWLHKTIRRKAVSALPAASRERYEEEWEGNLGEIPGDIFKLIYSLGLLRAALGIRGASRKKRSSPDAGFGFLERSIDILFSGAALLFFAPAISLIAIGIRASSRGPVLYGSVRRGRGGRPFYRLKFRTMGHPTVDGVRVTSFGRFLRKYSLDELPQLINVLRGDMTIFGPRSWER